MTDETMYDGTYDEALERFHATGPEFEGWMSNHGPMAVEALARRGDGARVHAWTDDYLDRLDERPRGIDPIAPEAWRDPLGDAVRTGDWIDLMLREVDERPWEDTLALWWPRLLPGIAAGATHGVIRVGHAVEALRAEETAPRRAELAHALAYWAARWYPVPSLVARGTRTAADALDGVPAIAEQRFGIRSRLGQLAGTPGWAAAVESRAPVGGGNGPAVAMSSGGAATCDDVVTPAGRLTEIVDATVAAYAHLAEGNPTMLVHAATAPAAVARVLPSLPVELHADAVDTVWTAACAVVAAYRPARPRPEEVRRATLAGRDAGELWRDAVANGDEHAIKFADVALASAARTGDETTREAAAAAVELLV